MPALWFVLCVLAVITLVIAQALRRARRAEFIRGYEFPRGLFAALQKQHPQLSPKDCQLVAQALRQFFGAYLRGGRQHVSMPSQVADDLWHQFILYTRNYDAFCRRAFGRFMHHTPAAVLGSARVSNTGLRRCWWHCCRAENINPRAPGRLPLLFAIDSKLKIAGGFHYLANCGPLKAAAGEAGATAVYCGESFADASFDGSTDGFGDAGSSSSGSDGGGDGSSCGGGGCGS
jgi:hypothetical protein